MVLCLRFFFYCRFGAFVRFGTEFESPVEVIFFFMVILVAMHFAGIRFWLVLAYRKRL